MKRCGPRILHKEVVEVRRSNRVAKIPAKEYNEAVTYECFEFERRIYKRSGNGTRDFSNRVYASDKERATAICKAEEVELGLGGDYPTFVKPMTQSHVTGGFWLGLPRFFCHKNLPRRDEAVTLIDEKGEEFPTVYLAHKNGLSGGWRGFSIDHGLVDGDALVFQLIRPIAFKVYIIRAYNSEKRDEL